MRSSRSKMQPFARHWPSGQPSVTAVLVVVSVIAALGQCSFWLFDRSDLVSQATLFHWLALQADSASAWHFWQFFSFPLLHTHALHLLANLLVLYFAGREVEPIVGRRHFIGLYLLANFLGGLAQWTAMVTGAAPADAMVVGVSAGVSAILAAYATILPELDVTLLIFFVLPVRLRAKFLGMALVATAGVLWFLGKGARLGPAGMLAGCVVGWLYVKRLGFGNPLAIERYLCDRRQHAARLQRMPAAQFIREEIDPILEKIARSGAGSLSRRERKLLEQGREKLAAGGK